MLVPYLILGGLVTNQPRSWRTQSFPGGVTVEAPLTLKKRPRMVGDKGLTNVGIWAAAGLPAFTLSLSIPKNPNGLETSNLMSGTVAGFASAGPESKIVAERDRVFHGWPAIDVTTVDSTGVHQAMRFVATKTLCVQLDCVYFGDRPTDADRYLDSLRLPDLIGKGPLGTPGAQLRRFPLGVSSLSALFPRQPERESEPSSNPPAVGDLITYSADYATRAFVVQYRDVSADTASAISASPDYLEELSNKVAKGLGGKVSRFRTAPLGVEKAGWFDVQMPLDMVAKGAIELHAGRMICVFVVEPKAYEEGPAVDAFLHSVEFGKVGP